MGGYKLPAPEKTSIAATAWKGVKLEMFVYHIRDNGIIEHSYSGGWQSWNRSITREAPAEHISVLRWSSQSVRVYFVDDKGLAEVVCSDGNTTQTLILAKSSQGDSDASIEHQTPQGRAGPDNSKDQTYATESQPSKYTLPVSRRSSLIRRILSVLNCCSANGE